MVQSLNPSSLVLIGLVLTSFWIMTGRGYRRRPFFLFYLSGIALILISLEYKIPLSDFWSVRKGRLYFAGILLLFGSKIISRMFFLNPGRTDILFISLIFPLAGLAAFLDSTPFDQELEISYQEGVERITSAFSPLYRENEELKLYLNKLLQDDSLDPEEKEFRIKELQDQIARLEKDMASFEQMKEENSRYEKQIAALKERIGSVSLCPGLTEDASMVTSYSIAIRPEVPCVRDFAVTLAKESPGSYYRAGSRSSPGKEGIGQIFTIHRYLSGNWKYINDPLFVSKDYYSPAEIIPKYFINHLTKEFFMKKGIKSFNNFLFPLFVLSGGYLIYQQAAELTTLQLLYPTFLVAFYSLLISLTLRSASESECDHYSDSIYFMSSQAVVEDSMLESISEYLEDRKENLKIFNSIEGNYLQSLDDFSVTTRAFCGNLKEQGEALKGITGSLKDSYRSQTEDVSAYCEAIKELSEALRTLHRDCDAVPVESLSDGLCTLTRDTGELDAVLDSLISIIDRKLEVVLR